MKIGIDIDGTITANPEFFNKLIASHLKAGDEIHIITGGLEDCDLKLSFDRPERITQLNKIGITEWTVLVRCSARTTDEVAIGKGEYCNANSIDCLYEDTISYIDAVKRFSPMTQTFLIQ